MSTQHRLVKGAALLALLAMASYVQAEAAPDAKPIPSSIRYEAHISAGHTDPPARGSHQSI